MDGRTEDKSIVKKVEVKMMNNKLNEKFWTACVKDRLQTAHRYLLEGADINYHNGRSGTALNAVSHNPFLTDIAKMLINRGADVNAIDVYKVTPAMYATNTKNIDLLAMLVEKNADFKLQDESGWTVLDWAFSNGEKRILTESELFEFFYEHRNVLSEEDRKWMENQQMRMLL